MTQPHALPKSTAKLDGLLHDVLAAPACVVPYDSFPRQDIVFYGGGRLGKMASRLLAKAGIKVATIIDKNAAVLKKTFDAPVLTIEEAVEQLDKDTFIFDCVFKDQFQLAQSILAPYGFQNIYTIYDFLQTVPSLHFTNGWQAGALSTEDKQGIATVYENLVDDASRGAYLTNLAWRIARSKPELDNAGTISEEDKYWSDITRRPFLAGKHLIDAGTFDLFFTRQALDPAWNPYQPAGIIALEPDPESLARCKTIFSSLPPEQQAKVTLSPQAVSGRAGAVQLIGGNDLSSKLVYGDNLSGKETLVACESVTLDALGKTLPAIGYIKLHVEGEELPCIRGGLECIAKHRPIVAVNCSHNRDGLWALAHFLIEHTQNYRYYFRAYAQYGEGLTFYAVPA